MNRVLELPPELLWHILTFLSVKDIYCCKLSCPELHKSTLNDNFWREIYENMNGKESDGSDNYFPEKTTWKEKVKESSLIFTRSKSKYLDYTGGLVEVKMRNDDRYDMLIKVIVCGPEDTGKTSAFQRACDEPFPETYISTVGVDFRRVIYNYKKLAVVLQMWDTSGRKRFRTITNSYLSGSNVVIFMFDMCKKSTLKELESYVTACKERVNMKTTLFVLAGSKMDIYKELREKKNKHIVRTEEIIKFMGKHKDLNLDFVAVSAKDNFNCRFLFDFSIRKELAFSQCSVREEAPNELKILNLKE